MKRILCLVICIFTCFMFGCSSNNDTNESNREKREVIEEAEYYRVYKGTLTEVCYEIYDTNGKVVLSKETDNLVEIDMLNNHIVLIKTGLGTGISNYKYYDASKGVFSQDYTYVLANTNDLVAYMEVPKENPMENRKVVVQNMFDKVLFYKEYQLDFARIDTPVIKALFLNNGTQIQLTYLSGEDQTKIITTLDIT